MEASGMQMMTEFFWENIFTIYLDSEIYKSYSSHLIFRSVLNLYTCTFKIKI